MPCGVVTIVFVATVCVSVVVTVEVSEVVPSLVASPPQEVRKNSAANNGSKRGLNRFIWFVLELKNGRAGRGMQGIRGE